MCNKCGKNYNIADIYLPATGSQPEIVMPPLSPPEQCVPHMEQRADDTEEVVRRRLEVGSSTGCGSLLSCACLVAWVHEASTGVCAEEVARRRLEAGWS